VLPEVDLVITHGGNNTVTECMHHGKPMVLLPVFWDQHDNAQRLHETGFGERVATYSFTDAEIAEAIDRLLGDEGLHVRLGEVSQRLQANPGNVHAADLIERLAETGEPIRG
jgi:UDP:flavonoid glycosyltransferase YjiC (YdhE family)